MAIIQVNHSVLRDVADAITTYCATQDREILAADSEIKSMLSTDWIGQDAAEFGRQWEGVDDRDSTTVKFRESLKYYGESLNACAAEYKKAQEDVYNTANQLPKWLYW